MSTVYSLTGVTDDKPTDKASVIKTTPNFETKFTSYWEDRLMQPCSLMRQTFVGINASFINDMHSTYCRYLKKFSKSSCCMSNQNKLRL